MAVGIWSGELRKMFFDCSVVSILFFLLSTHLNSLSTTACEQGQSGTDGEERIGIGPTRAARET